MAIRVNNSNSDDSIYFVNLGDSRAVYFNDFGQIIFATEDHKPDDYSERERISKTEGGIVHPSYGIYRVYNGNHNIGLAVSRAMGDISHKINTQGEYLGINSPVSPNPDITRVNTEPGYIVLASDGFWDVFSNEEAINEILTLLNSGTHITDLCKILTKAAINRRSKDNTTVLVVQIHT